MCNPVSQTQLDHTVNTRELKHTTNTIYTHEPQRSMYSEQHQTTTRTTDVDMPHKIRRGRRPVQISPWAGVTATPFETSILAPKATKLTSVLSNPVELFERSSAATDRVIALAEKQNRERMNRGNDAFVDMSTSEMTRLRDQENENAEHNVKRTRIEKTWALAVTMLAPKPSVPQHSITPKQSVTQPSRSVPKLPSPQWMHLNLQPSSSNTKTSASTKPASSNPAPSRQPSKPKVHNPPSASQPSKSNELKPRFTLGTPD
jgi:hypothetical protein